MKESKEDLVFSTDVPGAVMITSTAEDGREAVSVVLKQGKEMNLPLEKVQTNRWVFITILNGVALVSKEGAQGVILRGGEQRAFEVGDLKVEAVVGSLHFFFRRGDVVTRDNTRMSREEIINLLKKNADDNSNKGKMIELTCDSGKVGGKQVLYGRFDHIGGNMDGRATVVILDNGQSHSLDKLVRVRILY